MFLLVCSFVWILLHIDRCWSFNAKSIFIQVKLATVVKGNPKASFSIATTPNVGEGATSFPGLLQYTFDTYLIMLSVKQDGIKYYFLSLWYDLTWD